MSRPITEIAAELESLTDGDPEASHVRADELLIEALKQIIYAYETIEEEDGLVRHVVTIASSALAAYENNGGAT